MEELLIRKSLIDKFNEYIVENYQQYCQTHNLNISPDTMISYLLDHDLISPRAAKSYAIKQEFSRQLPLAKHKTATVSVLASKFNISERSIWIALKENNS